MSHKPFPHASILWRRWAQICRLKGSRAAFIDAPSDRWVSFQTLYEETAALAPSFEKTTGTAVAYFLPNSEEWLRVFFALQAVGASALPLDASVPLEARRERARMLGASFIWEDGHLVPLRTRRKLLPGVVCIKSTSGSTGKVRALPCKADHLLHDGKNIVATMDIRPDDIHLGLVPFSHSYGLGNLILPLLLQGNPIVAAADFVPSQIIRWIRKYQVTVFPSVPAILHALANLKGRSELPSLRFAISAGAPLAPETASHFYKCFKKPVHNLYGASETGSICFDRSGAASRSGRSIGTPLENVRVRILSDGRIEVKSRTVVFPKGSHILPDCGEWNEHGELRLLGRVRPLANIGGRKVHPMEVETILTAMKGVREARVMVIPGRRDILAACVETRLTKEVIMERLRTSLPEWKIPRRWMVSMALPRNGRGKIDLEQLFQ